ncbi:MAG: HSP20 family protein [Hyphomicrobiaceae bacterium]|jgi:HSP20 family protein
MMLKNQCSVPQTRDPIRSLFSQFFGDSLAETSDSETARRHSPRLNVSETDQAFVLAFDLPGVTDKDIQVELQDATLTVTAERLDTRDKDDKETRWHRLEHRYGQYSRAISLPVTAASDGVEAVYQAGVLTVTVPKRAEAKPAKISVRTA